MSEDQKDETFEEKQQVEVVIKKDQKNADEKRLDELEKTQNLMLDGIGKLEFQRRSKDLLDQAKKVGFSLAKENIETPEDLQALEKVVGRLEAEKNLKTKPVTGGAPLSGQQFDSDFHDNAGKPMNDRVYRDEAEMISDLEKEAQSGSEQSLEAKKILGQLGKKALEHLCLGHEFEFEGSITKFNENANVVTTDEKKKAEHEAVAQAEKKKWKKVR